jgi:hypothetical protein
MPQRSLPVRLPQRRLASADKRVWAVTAQARRARRAQPAEGECMMALTCPGLRDHTREEPADHTQSAHALRLKSQRSCRRQYPTTDWRLYRYKFDSRRHAAPHQRPRPRRVRTIAVRSGCSQVNLVALKSATVASPPEPCALRSPDQLREILTLKGSRLAVPRSICSARMCSDEPCFAHASKTAQIVP